MTAIKIKDGQPPVDLGPLLGAVGWSGAELARRVDVSPSTAYKWIKRGEAPGAVIAYLDLILRFRALHIGLGDLAYDPDKV